MVHLTWPWELQLAHRASNWSQLNWVKQADTTAMMHNCLHFVNEHMVVTSVFEWNLILCRSTSTQSCVNETLMSWEQHTLEILICRTPLNLSKRLYCDVRRAVVSCVVCPIWSQRHLSAETFYLPSEIRALWWTLLWYLKFWRTFLKWKTGNFIYTKKCDEVSLFTHGSRFVYCGCWGCLRSCEVCRSEERRKHATCLLFVCRMKVTTTNIGTFITSETKWVGSPK